MENYVRVVNQIDGCVRAIKYNNCVNNRENVVMSTNIEFAQKSSNKFLLKIFYKH